MKNADMPAMPLTLNPGEFAADGMNLDGLTKREYFAGLAMQGLCNSEHMRDAATEAQLAVAMADALLAELGKEAT